MGRYVLDQINVSSEEFDGEVVAVNFNTGKYYGMRGCADRIWRFFEAPHTEDEAVDFIARVFGAGHADVSGPVRGFVDQLRNEGILLPSDAAGSIEPHALETAPTGRFEPPLLEVHSDLQELILLDPVHEADPEHGWPLRRTETDR